MRTVEEIGVHELKDLLLRNWMTHDGMWFSHCVQALGIEQTNQLNRAAIKSLAEIEVKRAKKIQGMTKDRVGNFEELKDFIEGIFALSLGDFMGGTFSFPAENVMHWEVEDHGCFAYKGIKRLGVIDRYECGVLYRVLCWLENVGVRYRVSRPVSGCLFHQHGECKGDVVFSFP